VSATLVFSPLARGQQPKSGIRGQGVSAVGILVAGQATVHGLAEQIRQGEVAVTSSAGIGEVSRDERV
jgi:hypothetical protein